MAQRIRSWTSPYRQVAVWLLVALCALTTVSAAMFYGGLLGGFLSLPVTFGMAVYALVVIFIGCREGWRRRERMGAALIAAWSAPVVVATTVLAALPIMWAVTSGLTWATFLINRSSYEDIAERVATGQLRQEETVGWQEAGGLNFVIDDGPPHRVAFPLPGGFLDNWNGIVFDPTGKVLLAKGFTPGGGYTAPPAIHGLFDGDIVSCSHLLGAFYQCSFT